MHSNERGRCIELVSENLLSSVSPWISDDALGSSSCNDYNQLKIHLREFAEYFQCKFKILCA